MRSKLKRRPFLCFVILTFSITIVFHVLHELGVHGVIERVKAFDRLAAAGPSIAAILLTLAIYGTAGLKDLLKGLIPQRSNWHWLLLCFLLPPIESLTKVLVFAAADVEIPPIQYLSLPDWLLSIASYSFLRAGIGEELGWRGFAQPHLQVSMNAFKSSILIGLVWSCWHFPKWFIVFGYSVSWLLLIFLLM